MIDTDAGVNPGTSGGPLIGQNGPVYGLVDAKNSQAEGIAFAVPGHKLPRTSLAGAARPNCPQPYLVPPVKLPIHRSDSG
jgi:hypothetical protein